MDCDGDLDGYDRVELPLCPPGPGGLGADCDDEDASINPAAAEDLGTAADDDCDGLYHIHQRVNAPMKSGLWWTSTLVDWSSKDYARLEPFLGTSSIKLKDDVAWDSGELHVGLAVSYASAPAATCTVGVGVDGGPVLSIGSFSTDGEHDFSYSGSPPYTITDLEVTCPASAYPGWVAIDYLSLSNGAYFWPPPGDLEVVYDHTAFPGGGYTTSVVRNHAASGELLAAVNTGGVAWSYDSGSTWWSINGELSGSQLAYGDQLAVYDVLASDVATYWAISGRDFGSYGMAGALYRSTDGGDTWEEADPDVTVDPRDHACGGYKAFAGGQLLAHEQVLGNDYLFYVDHTAGAEGVRAMDADTLADCEPGSGDDGLLDGLPSGEQVAALDSVVVGDDTFLVVGFKTVVDNDSALYLCELDGSCGTTPSASGCFPISDTGWDVRDLETMVVDSQTSLVYAIDAGRRVSTDGLGTCDAHVEGSVYAVQLQPGSTEAVSATVWDTDSSTGSNPNCFASPTTDCPAWLTNSSFATILKEGYGAGELRNKTIDDLGENELTGLALSDDAQTLLTFFRRGTGQSYDVQPVYRADVSTPPVPTTTLAWVPLQDYTSSDALSETDPLGTPGNHEERALVVDPSGAWLSSLDPYDALETWFPVQPVDGVFATSDGESTADVIVNGGMGLYRLPHAQGGAPGWDSPYGDPSIDLDEIPWSWAMEPTGDFQGTVATEVAFCDTCSPGGVDADGLAWATAWDVTMEGLYGAPSSSSTREAADWDCHWDTWGAGGRDVDLVEHAGAGATVWAVLQHQDETSAPTHQAVVKAEVGATDGHEDVRFCFETTSSYLTDGMNSVFSSEEGSYGEWRCDRDPQYDTGGVDSTWPGCSGEETTPGTLLSTATGDYGNPYDVSALEDDADVAVVAFRPFGSTGSYSTRGGLALFYDDGYDMALRELGFPGLSACGSLGEDEVFQGGPMVAIDQPVSWWNSPTDHDLTLYVAITSGSVNVDDDCALLRVEVTPSGETWTAIPIGSNLDPRNACSELTAGRIQGMTLAPWAEDTVFLFGNDSYDGYLCEVDVSDPANPVVVQMANPAGVLRPIRSVAPHPHLVDTLVVGLGGASSELCAVVTCEEPELFQASWRLIPTTGSYRVQWNAYPGAWLINPNVTGLDFDTVGAGIPAVQSFVVATSGSGVLEGLVGWTLSP